MPETVDTLLVEAVSSLYFPSIECYTPRKKKIEFLP